MPLSAAHPFSLDEAIADRLQRLGELPSTADSMPGQPARIDLAGAPRAMAGHEEHDPDDVGGTRSHRISCAGGDIWVSGSALLCSCPDCNAPMTIRLWLGLADCWRCPTSIDLSREQLAAAQELVARQIPAGLPKPSRSGAAPAIVAPPPVPRSWNPPPVPVPAGPSETELQRLSRSSPLAGLLRRGLSNIPAWLVSFLLHLVVILILALIVLSDQGFLPSRITLSTFLSPEKREGGDIRVEDPLHALQDDLALASKMDLDNEELRDILQQASDDARELQTDPQPRAPLPDLDQVRKNITTAQGPSMSFAARDPRVRAEMVLQQGGTTITEAAVARGLRWLASVQNQNGGWNLRDYGKSGDPDNPSDTMATSLALLPMLGAGQTHEYGLHKECVARGLAWLLDHQLPNGDLRAGYTGNPGMYAHGQATIVLCEALALTGDQQFLEPAQRAIRFIEAAQHGKGGWRYQPGQPGDTSVFGWQMMALQSAKASGGSLTIDDATLKLADYYLDQVMAPARFENRRRSPLPEGSAYAYMPGREATATMTAEAILCRMYLGWKKNDPRLDSAVRWLSQEHLPNSRNRNLYYWYYATQVMHHYGGRPWETWNERMRSELISTQQTGGRYPGSWRPTDFEWGPQGGRIYTTSLAVCTLEVYYRHLPIFHQISLDR